MSEQWGPWIIFIQGVMPVPPETVVQVEMGFAFSGDFLGPMLAKQFDWYCPQDPIARYRIRKPRGHAILDHALQPQTEGALS